MQTEWSVSKHQLMAAEGGHTLVDEERAERQRWGEWARNAAELERRRRVMLLKELE